MNGLDYYGVTSDLVFYSLAVASGIAIVARKALNKISFERKAVIFILCMVALRLFFFATSSENEFPTGEVYAADVPGLQHPYAMPWQAPYGILWYWITQTASYLVLPFVTLAMHFISPSCECLVKLTYLDGHVTELAYSYTQFLLGISMMVGYTIIELPFYWYLRKSTLLVPFFITDNFFWATTPVNVPILLLSVLAIWKWQLLPLAPLAKLPVGAPMAVWQFAFGSASTPGHWFPHIMYGLWWLAAIVRWTPWRHAWNFKADSAQVERLKAEQERFLAV